MTMSRSGFKAIVVLACFVAAITGGRDVNARPQQSASVSTVNGQSDRQQYQTLVNRYCVVCHNATVKTAGLLLDKEDLAQVTTDPVVWEKVIWRLRTASMPPIGMPRPKPADSDAFATWLETSLDAAAAAHPNPGHPLIHRLNRAEYGNAVRDLLDLHDVDITS